MRDSYEVRWKVILVIGAYFPGAGNTPAGMLGPTEVTVVQGLESIHRAIIVNLDLVCLICLQFQLDRASAQCLREGMAAVGRTHGDSPGAIVSLGNSLTGFPTEPVGLGVLECALTLNDGTGFATGTPPICLGGNSEGVGSVAIARSSSTCGKNHAGEEGDDHKEHRENFLCHLN